MTDRIRRHAGADRLAPEVAERLGLADAPTVVRQLEQLSARLWAKPHSLDDRVPFSRVADRPEADAIVALVDAHADRVKRMSLGALAKQRRRDVDHRPRADAAAVLVTGMLAFGAAPRDPRQSERFIPALMRIALAEDELSVLARRVILGGVGDDWPPPFPGGGHLPPPLDGNCLFDLQEAAGRLGGMGGGVTVATMPISDATGITGLVPNRGSAGDLVSIVGLFPAIPPPDMTIMFPKAGGGIAPVTSFTWGTTIGTARVREIIVEVPEQVGDGPVGFVTYPGASLKGYLDPSAAMEFATALGDCLGSGAGAVGGGVSGLPPVGVAVAVPPIPTLPGDVNIFHGGPVLVSVSADHGAEPDPAITVTGLNLQQGDTVILENTPAPTTFVSATKLTFHVPAMIAAATLLTIRRGIHRSNGTSFDVRASLVKTAPPARVMPGTLANLQGTGFGPQITAMIDGAGVRVFVSPTHSASVLIQRPARTPVVTESRGEPVTVEVFDRGRSLGTVTVLVGTIRIASFGDSIVWGQGLLEADKFTTLAATAVAARRKPGSIAVFSVDRSAHSGATLLPASDPFDPLQPRLPGDFTGECPASSPSVASQVRQWTARHTAADRSEIDLVILDGGINDIGVFTILTPDLSDPGLVTATMAMCGTAMTSVLTSVLATFPSAAVIVTGYYQIVSEQSDLGMLLPALYAAGTIAGFVTSALAPLIPGVPPGLELILGEALKAWIHERLSYRSALFATTANLMLQTAVTTATPPGRKVALAVPAFGPQNAIFAPDPFLWGVGVTTGGLVPLDPVAPIRLALTGPPCAPSLITTIASIGHPNVRGAMAYGTAIEGALAAMNF